MKNNRVAAQENDQEQADGFGICSYFLVGLSYFLAIITFPFSLCVCMKIVNEFQRAVIFRLGRSGGAKGPGLFFILPCIDNIIIIDLRTVTFDVPPQEILTKDSVTVTVDAVVYFKIFDPILSVNKVSNANLSTRLLAATTLRNALGTKTLQEILQERETIAHNMQDVRLPISMQRAMATEAESSREARAKVIAAEGEQKASMALRQAGDIINQSPVALQLRYLQTLTQIAAEKNSTIIFPVPIEMLRTFGSLGTNQKPSSNTHSSSSTTNSSSQAINSSIIMNSSVAPNLPTVTLPAPAINTHTPPSSINP